MYLIDYHTHSKLSPDGFVPLSQMADAAVAAGIDELCLTDHCDLVDQDGVPSSGYNWAPGVAQFAQTAPQYDDRLTLKLGLEFGVGHVNPSAAEKILSQPELDFVIGSIHNLCYGDMSCGPDFYFGDYSTPEGCYAALDNYFTSMALLADSPFYDVLGHIIYPLRYMPNPVPLDRYMDRIQEILRIAVGHGKGLEINTWRGKTVAEWRPVLERFRAVGGEVITIGSDAHTPEGVGQGVRESMALLQEMGFRYITSFDKRKPVFHRIEGR